MDRGIAGNVASTGRVLNIIDAYTDERFNRFEILHFQITYFNLQRS
jgi:hypothetical protein